MGVISASLRRPDVVMAPALTEAGQSQNFKLAPTSHSAPSPISLSFDGHKHVSVTGFLSDNLIHDIEQFKKRNIDCDKLNLLNGVKNQLKYQFDPKSLVFENLKTLAIASELLNEFSTSKESYLNRLNTFVTDNGDIMNNSDPSMGDSKDKMGLQKSNLRVVGNGRMNKIKDITEVEQLIRTWGAVVSGNSNILSGEIAGCTSSRRNTNDNYNKPKASEKLIVPPSVALDRNTDLCSEKLVSNDGPNTSVFQVPNRTDINFEKELLNDVDIMGMCVEDNINEEGLPIKIKRGIIKDQLELIRKTKFELDRKCEFLLRRLRNYHARIVARHVEHQVTGFLEYSSDLLKQSSSQRELGNVECSAITSESASVSDPRRSVCGKSLGSDSVSGMFRNESPSRMSNVSSKQVNKYCGANTDLCIGSINFLAGAHPQFKFTSEVLNDLQSVSGQLQSHLKFVQREFDSDVTASSSGGESCDELQSDGDNSRHRLPIEKRAAWRWAQYRARIASRWTWLQAQISDLEYRIRQHNDIHRQIRLAKDPVMLAEIPSLSTAVVVNGYHGSSPVPSANKSEQWCARTRPLVRQQLTKRKLLHVQGLHMLSKRAARPASVRCTCRQPVSSCALCTGRPDPTMPAAMRHHLPLDERAALLDPAFHPVLSMPSDIKENLHYEAFMKTSEWQQKTLRSSLKSMRAAGLPRFDRDTSLDRRHKKHQLEPRRKYTSRLKKTVTNTLTAKIKKKLTKGRKPKNSQTDNHTLQRLKRKKNSAKSLNAPYVGCDDVDEDAPDGMSSSSKHASPTASPCPASGLSERLSQAAVCKVAGESFKRKRENSYDIDNIVIPYSIASSTRVERLPYKEIPTPKWRVIEYNYYGQKLDIRNNGIVRRSSQESDVEDISEETIALRHDRCEMEEKKKFMSYIKLPYSGRSRANRRTDSRAESSGANTPDPMSPNPSEHQDGISPVMSPLPPPHDVDQCLPTSARRRTTSSSRWCREELRCTTPDSIPEVPSYESRIFPLSDETYEKMIKCMPDGHPHHPSFPQPKTWVTKDNEYKESQPVSPSTDSTESAIGEGEDPNDPEWTVEEEKEFERERFKSSVKR